MNNNVYININDFEVFVRKHFDKIINGEGLTIPRQIVGYAIDEIFQEGEQQVIHRSGEHYLEISLRKE